MAGTDSAKSNLPHLRVVSWNMKSALAYTTHWDSVDRRKARFKLILSFSHTHDIIFLQETHLAPDELYALNHPTWTVLYNNSPNSKQAGTVIIVPNRILITHLIIHHIIQPGYIQRIRVFPRNKSHSSRYTNFYGQTGPNHLKLIAKQLDLLTEEPEHRYDITAGDWNFKDAPNQTSSTPKPLPLAFLRSWEAFREKHSLSMVPSDQHTYTHHTGSTHLLDRYYSNLSEVDRTQFTPVVYTHYSHNIALLSDHLPVTLEFLHRSHVRRQTSIPAWLPAVPQYRTLVRQDFAKRRTRCKDAFAEEQLLKQIGKKMARTFLRKQKSSPPTHYPQRMAIATAALAEVLRPNPRPGELERLAALDPALPSLLPTPNYSPTTRMEEYTTELLKQALPAPQKGWTSVTQGTNKCFLARAKAFLPSTKTSLLALRPDVNSPTTTDPVEIATILKGSWEKVWAHTPVDHSLVDSTLKEYKKKISATPEIPTVELITKTILDADHTSPGPDGTPFSFLKNFVDLFAPLLMKITNLLMEGRIPPVGFNYALVFFVPKKLTDLPEDTRPISVPNASNNRSKSFGFPSPPGHFPYTGESPNLWYSRPTHPRKLRVAGELLLLLPFQKETNVHLAF